MKANFFQMICRAFIVAAISLSCTTWSNAQTATPLFSFSDRIPGGLPFSNLISDSQGNLYGTAAQGGNLLCPYAINVGCGVVFELSRASDGWKEAVLYTFVGTDGMAPDGGLIFDDVGNLYGTTSGGGLQHCSCGTVFKLTPSASGEWTLTSLYTFSGFDGGVPLSNLTLDSTGNLYGTAYAGGLTVCYNGCGVVFELSPSSNGTWKETVLHKFNQTDGSYPESGLIIDKAGNLYGTATAGGNLNCSGFDFVGCGLVFELSPRSSGEWGETVLRTFTGINGGWQPFDSLTFDAQGNLYGTTALGGTDTHEPGCNVGCGLVFELSRSSSGDWNEEVLYSFTGADDGANPAANVVFDSAGNLYGTTQYDGDGGQGTVFKLLPSSSGSWNFQVLTTFNGFLLGALPESGLLVDAAGNLYGTTPYGGGQGWGTVFEITP